MAIVVFLSTGRCGTQFATSLLARACAERAEVVHEPLRAAYAPRLTLRSSRLDRDLQQMEDVRRHFEHVDRVIRDQGRCYIETGWPILSWLPWLKQRYADRLVVVHLVREPLRFAFSMASHNFYTPGVRDDDYSRLAVLHPGDAGVQHREYALFWEQLNIVEKCLFFWLEVNSYAEQLKAGFDLPWLTVRSKDLFRAPSEFLHRLRACHPHLQSAIDPRVQLDETVDRFHYPLRQSFQGVRIAPDVIALAQRYGFSNPTDFETLKQRFSPSHA